MNKEEFASLLEEDARIDDLLESDYDFFCEHYKNDIKLLQDTLFSLEKLHDLNGWEFCLDELLDMRFR